MRFRKLIFAHIREVFLALGLIMFFLPFSILRNFFLIVLSDFVGKHCLGGLVELFKVLTGWLGFSIVEVKMVIHAGVYLLLGLLGVILGLLRLRIVIMVAFLGLLEHLIVVFKSKLSLITLFAFRLVYAFVLFHFHVQAI